MLPTNVVVDEEIEKSCRRAMNPVDRARFLGL